jgi:hypothetical protein
LAANTRTKSIASNQQISAPAAAIGEMNVNTAAVLLDPFEHMSEMIALTIDRL